jgi:oxalate decarboxylase/phosphoglucose isomerase-like protein (cupin superfamily)
VWASDGKPKKNFEWQEHSMFLVPRNHWHVFSNMQGDKPIRLFHYSYMPMAMSALPEPDMYFNNPYESKISVADGDFYSEAKMVQAKDADEGLGMRAFWYGNFFPDMRAWNKLDANERRGAGGKSVFMQFPNSELTAHMSVFAPKTYKKAHRHGPGRAIIIPAGEGYSIMWEEGKEKIVCPWHECSMITPPDKWFHQHFNAGGDMARYLALHPPMQFHGHAEKVEDRAKDQIEYPREDPFIRRKFEEELAKRGIKSIMPEECYTNPDYEWSKAMGKQ